MEEGILAMSRKTIGILGGMGPAATLELFERIINNTVAEADQDHVSLIIINDPQIPDRTKFIMGEGPSPVERLMDNINKLSNAGADVVIIPCMTAHSFISVLQERSPIPIINAIELVERYIQRNHPNVNKIGLLATDGSVKSGVFQQFISDEIVVPNVEKQKELMDIIYGKEGIKSNNYHDQIFERISSITDDLKKSNAEAIIAGCTELSLVMDEENLQIPVIDPITILAKETVEIGTRDN